MKPSLPRRRLIPKWRPVSVTLNETEATSTERHATKNFQDNPEDFDKAIAEWRESKEPGLLGEVLSFSVHHDLLDRVIEIGDEALHSGAKVTRVQTALIKDLRKDINLPVVRIIEPSLAGGVHPFQLPIRRLRALLRTAPDNAFALLDYAQLQAAVGKLPSAERAIRTALSLAPNNRTVIRSAARFFVHAGKPDTAHRLIRRHERTPSDPWLMASEIALADAAGAQASFLAKGKRMLRESTRFSPGHLTELAGAVALTELDAGNLKRAREAQRNALLLPNDNVIAQAVDHEYLFGIQLEGSNIEKALARSSEALLLQAWANLAPDSVEQQAQNWHSEEPFSSRPIQILTTLYAYTGDFEKFMRWIRAGLLTDPNDSGLLINLAYGQARMNQIVEATSTIRKLRSLGSSTAEPFVKATEGLIAYQQGRFEVGDELYNAAIALLNSTKTKENAAYGRLNQALSALDYQHPNADEIVRQANNALRGHATSDSAMLLKIRNTKAIDDVQLEHQELRRLSQWRYDPITNSLIERRGITAVNAKPMTNLDPVYKKI